MKKLLLLMSFLFFSFNLLAQAPPYPEYLEKINKGLVPVPDVLANPDKYENWEVNWPKPEFKAKLKKAGFNPDQTNILTGNVNVLVVLVDFSDNVAKIPATYFDNLAFDTTSANPWSVSNYYRSVTYRKTKIITQNKPSVLGWIRMDKTYSYYVGSDYGHTKSSEFVTDVLAKIDAQVDFTQYDNDGDGKIEGLIIVHAGPGAEVGAANAIWSHAGWGTYIPAYDGKKVNRYSICPEIYTGTTAVKPGVFCHELGHSLFNFIDTYDRHSNNSEGYQSQGLGNWTLMASGSYLGATTNDGSKPCRPDLYNLVKYGIISPKLLTSSKKDIILKPVNDTSLIYKIPYQSTSSTAKTYYLVEYRKKTGIDERIPGEGVFIYRIDENVQTQNDYEWIHASVNPANHTNQGHYIAALIQADGLYQLEKSTSDGGNSGDAGDPFPGSTNKTEYTFVTFPSSVDYDGIRQTINIRNITIVSNDLAKFDLERGFLYSHSTVSTPILPKTFNDTLFVDFKVANASGSITQVNNVELKFNNQNISFPSNFTLPTNLLNNNYFTIPLAISLDNAGNFIDTLKITVGSNDLAIPIIANIKEFGKVTDDQIYVVATPNSPFKLYTVNKNNAQNTILYSFPTEAQLPLIAVNPLNREIYGFMNYQTLFRYDLSNNGYYKVGNLPEQLNYATFNDKGELFAVTQSKKFVKVNLKDLTFEQITNKLYPFQAVVYDYHTNKFYVSLTSTINNIKNALYEFDLTTGDTIRVFTKNNNRIIGGMASDGNGNLYIIPPPEGLKYADLFKYNIANKTLDSIGNIGLRSTRSIVYMPSNVTSNENTVETYKPANYELYQNYPNPFNPTTSIKYTLPVDGFVNLSVYNVVGQKVTDLVNTYQKAGTYNISFNASYLPSGIYFVRMNSDKFTKTIKMILMK